MITGESGDKLFSPKIRFSEVRQGGVHFAKIGLRKTKNANWERIVSMLGKSKGRVVLGDFIYPPSGTGIIQFDSFHYSTALLKSGLEKLLFQNQYTAKKLSAVLIDMDCRWQMFADVLLQYCKSVKVITRERALYQNYVDEKFYYCGAAVSLFAPFEVPADVSFCVSPSNVILPVLLTKGMTSVFSECPVQRGEMSHILSDFQASVPEKWKTLIPSDIDGHLFQAAAYEYCGMRNLALRMPETFLFDGIRHGDYFGVFT